VLGPVGLETVGLEVEIEAGVTTGEDIIVIEVALKELTTLDLLMELLLGIYFGK
jgi:hypothetical protein